MELLEKLKKANPELPLFSVLDPAFSAYGRVLALGDCTALAAALEGTAIPAEGNCYQASVPSLEATPEAADVREVRLTFDTDLEFNAWLYRRAEELVKDYALEGSADGERWFTLADVEGNFQRHRIHRFAPRRLKALRLTVKATYGAPEANVFEIRAY